jgi:hypothetical protein
MNPHHRKMIGEVVAKAHGKPHAFAVRDVEAVVETIVRETISESDSADKVRARDYRRFIIESLTLEQCAEVGHGR